MNRLFMILLTVVLILPAGVMAAEKVIFATLSELPPNVFVKDGNITGCDVEIVRAVCKQISINPEFKLLPAKRALKYVREGSVDSVFLLRHTKKREKFFYYVSEPAMTKKIVIFVRRESDMKISSVDDLKGKVVSVVSGYEYIPEFENSEEIKKMPCDNEEQQVRTLNKARMDAAAAMEIPFRYFSREFGFQNKFRSVYVMSEVPVHVAFSKAAGEKGKALADKFGRALRQLKKEGGVENIINRYVD